MTQLQPPEAPWHCADRKRHDKRSQDPNPLVFTNRLLAIIIRSSDR